MLHIFGHETIIALETPFHCVQHVEETQWVLLRRQMDSDHENSSLSVELTNCDGLRENGGNGGGD